MKNIFASICSLFMLLIATAQNKTVNDPNAQMRKVSSFHGIKVSSGIHLFVNQGNEQAVAVSADSKENVERIVTEVEDGVLKIYFDNHHFWFNDDNSNKNLRAYVSCKLLDQLKASSGAHVEVDGSIQTESLVFNFSSGASFKGNVIAKDIELESSSGAHSVIGGNTNDIKAKASSGSHVDAASLNSNVCTADASSGAHLSVMVNHSLVASASSGGHIEYKGNAGVKTISTSSGGQVVKK